LALSSMGQDVLFTKAEHRYENERC
jgi:hypothetical protein